MAESEFELRHSDCSLTLLCYSAFLLLRASKKIAFVCGGRVACRHCDWLLQSRHWRPLQEMAVSNSRQFHACKVKSMWSTFTWCPPPFGRTRNEKSLKSHSTEKLYCSWVTIWLHLKVIVNLEIVELIMLPSLLWPTRKPTFVATS